MKKILMISLSFIFIFTLSGCSIQNDQNKNSNTSEKLGMLDFERPEEPPAFSGIVKTIIGNEVTILKIERPNRDENAERVNDEKTEQKKTSGMGRGMGMGTGMVSGDNSERLEMLKNMSAGEEKVIIPVGIKMLKNEDKKMVSATLDDISKDKMLTIWINGDIEDRNIASFVIIK